jgi:hypothetical protein
MIVESNVSDNDVLRMTSILGISRAEMVDDGIRKTIRFFRNVLKCDPFLWSSYIRGIDFHSRVEAPDLYPPQRLSRHKSRETAFSKPFVYFTVPGTSQYSTGTSFPESDYELFSFLFPMPCLKSRASGIKFHPGDQVVRAGGGAQFILSSANASQLIKIA